MAKTYINHSDIMTRKSVEFCATVFIIALIFAFILSVYKVMGMIGWV